MIKIVIDDLQLFVFCEAIFDQIFSYRKLTCKMITL